jgi:hypothetical protein
VFGMKKRRKDLGQFMAQFVFRLAQMLGRVVLGRVVLHGPSFIKNHLANTERPDFSAVPFTEHPVR